MPSTKLGRLICWSTGRMGKHLEACMPASKSLDVVQVVACHCSEGEFALCPEAGWLQGNVSGRHAWQTATSRLGLYPLCILQRLTPPTHAPISPACTHSATSLRSTPRHSLHSPLMHALTQALSHSLARSLAHEAQENAWTIASRRQWPPSPRKQRATFSSWRPPRLC